MLPDSAAVEPLLAERDALRGWLARLDEAGTSTPEAVRARVRADYEQRLDQVVDRLRGHADTLAARLAEDRIEYAEQVALLEAAEGALAEAELRHAVGEYDGATFEKAQARHGDEIVRCRLSRDAAQERVERLEAVFALVTQPAAVVPVESLAPTEEPSPAPVSTDRLDDALLSVFDEPKDTPEPESYSPLTFRPGTSAPTEPKTSRAVPPLHEVPPIGTPPEGLPRFSRPADMVPATLAQPTPDPVPDEPAAAAPVESGDGDELFGGSPIIASGPTPTAPTSGAPARTQRCGECGAMNKALEWYCEKCGAELTAA